MVVGGSRGDSELRRPPTSDRGPGGRCVPIGGEYPGPRSEVEAYAPPLGRRMPMPKLSPEWQQPGDLGSARPDNHTTSRRCSGVSLGSTQRRLATCFVTIGPWGVSRDQRRGGAGAAASSRCEGLCHRSTGFTPKKRTRSAIFPQSNMEEEERPPPLPPLPSLMLRRRFERS